MVYLSMATETGSVYTLAELAAIRAVCDEFSLYLFIDGARLSYGLEAIGGDVSLEDIAHLADVFYCGGTKCGALFGEAVVIVNDELKPHFRANMKQNGAMLAKGWLLGAQFEALFTDDLYFKVARRANEYAARVHSPVRADDDQPGLHQLHRRSVRADLRAVRVGIRGAHG